MPWAPSDEGANYIAGYLANAGTFQTSGGSAATADGDPVGEWQDQSGNGNHLSQATSGARPTLKTSGGPSGISGYYLLFDGSNDQIEANLGTLISGATAWLVGIICTKGTAAQYISVKRGTGENALITGFAGSGDFEYYGSSPRFTVASSPGAGFHSIAYGGDAGGMASRYDNAAGGSSGTADTGGVNVFGSSDGADYFNGNIAAVFVFDRYDATLLSNLEGYLYGLINPAAAGQPTRKRMGGMMGNPFGARGVW